jgi:MFS family permease
MLEVLRNPAYARLFAAQVVALLGTGLLTIALGLLAFDVAGSNAGVVLGTALTVKMLAYVGVAPVISAVTGHIPRKLLLVLADAIRAVVAISLPFVTEAWQIYLLIFVLQSASATFTPAVQAVIPDVLRDERHYTRALSLSRLAYDLESLISPILAAALLTVIGYNHLFVGTFAGFVSSALLVLMAAFPAAHPSSPTPLRERLTRGLRLFARIPELRSLLLMNLAVAAATALVVVNTVVIVQSILARPQGDVALLLAAYGAGSMIVALAVPRVLEYVDDRPVMLAGTIAIPSGLTAAGILAWRATEATPWIAFVVVWAVLGAGTSLILTPSSRLLRRNSDDDNRPAVFAAQFSLSHACFLITYPAAGLLGAHLGIPATAAIFTTLAGTAAVTAHTAWTRATSPRREVALGRI